ncbi:MAG: aspartate racemase [Candidatus Azotimanducaceae bacterium]|jgi:aspartate racemase
MKTIGMIGGMSWESTSAYYTKINRGVKAILGDLHSAKICLYSVDFYEIEKLQQAGDWQASAEILIKAARSVEAGGADFLIICTNTMHKVAPQIQEAISIPVLHIADATAAVLKANKIKNVGLLGTRFTMQQDFYKNIIIENYQIDVLVPRFSAQTVIHNIIYEELCLGEIKEKSREKYVDVIDELAVAGAEAIILGCTEITLLIQQTHTSVPLFDTTEIHAQAAVKLAIEH